MKVTLAVPSVCPELYSYMHFLDLSCTDFLSNNVFYIMYILSISLLPTFPIPDYKSHS